MINRIGGRLEPRQPLHESRPAHGERFCLGCTKNFYKKMGVSPFFYIFAKKRLPNPYYLNLWQTLQEETF